MRADVLKYFDVLIESAPIVSPSELEMEVFDEYYFDMRIIDHIRIGIDINKAMSDATLETFVVNRDMLESLNHKARESKKHWEEYLERLEQEIQSKEIRKTEGITSSDFTNG